MFKDGFRKVQEKYNYFYNPYIHETSKRESDMFEAELKNPLAYKSTKVFRERRRYVLNSTKKAEVGQLESLSSNKMRVKL